jgi:hypothetical protein
LCLDLSCSATNLIASSATVALVNNKFRSI